LRLIAIAVAIAKPQTDTRGLQRPAGDGEQVSADGEFAVYRVGGAPFTVRWYPGLPGTSELAKLLTWLVDTGSPHRAFSWPAAAVVSEEVPGFGLVMPVQEPGLESLGQLLSRAGSPPFPVLISIGRQLVSAFDALHESWLCYRDVSLGNVLVHPHRAEIALIGIDAIGPYLIDGYVGAASPFMAPEVVRGEAPVSWRTDRHSLAVLLFFLFMRGHPLRGRNADHGTGEEGELALQVFGLEPVFVFDPRDDSNRPVPGDPVLGWWPRYPPFFRGLFEQAFTAGLADPAKRVTEEQWLSALERLEDCGLGRD
jgi:DNA-binding helix-hairpin-helix protein with protein kinase domain